MSIDHTSRKAPKLGKCSCRPGIERDNCPACEGTGQRIDFRGIRRNREAEELARHGYFDDDQPKGPFAK